MSTSYSSRKAKITKDWAALCPGFKVWKPKHALRLHGPLVMGICLDAVRSRDEYQPCFHFHSLMTPFEVVTLSLEGPLLTAKGACHSVKVARHDAELESIAKKFFQQYPLVLDTTLTYTKYLQTVVNVINGKHGANRGFRPHMYCDIVLLACLCGAVDHAARELDTFYNDLSGRNDCEAPHVGGLNKWREGIELVLEQSKVAEIVSAEKARHKLDTFEDYGIVFDQEVRLFDLLQSSP